MIPNGKEMTWNGHYLVFESTTYQCRGCFFENMGSCPDCDEGIWVEDEQNCMNCAHLKKEKGRPVWKCELVEKARATDEDGEFFCEDYESL